LYFGLKNFQLRAVISVYFMYVAYSRPTGCPIKMTPYTLAKISITNGTFSAKFYTHMYSTKIHMLTILVYNFKVPYTDYDNIFSNPSQILYEFIQSYTIKQEKYKTIAKSG